MIVNSPLSSVVDEDSELVKLAKTGKAAAFESLYRKHYARVYRIAKGILVSTDDALDAVQEVFTQIYRKLPMFDERSTFATWLSHVAVNRCIQEARKKFKLRQREYELQQAVEIPDKAPKMEDPQVMASLGQLKPEDRAVLTLFYWEQDSVEEIATKMAMSPGAVKIRLHRARERFKEVYTRA